MDMDNSARGGKRGRGDSGRSSRAGGGRSAGGSRPQTRDRTLNAIQQAISENNNKDSAQANVRHGKGGKGNSTQISITGWRKSNASTKRDGGVENLISFCERKLNSAPKGSRFKVTKVSPCGSAVATHEFRLYTPSLHPTVSWLSPRKTRIALPLRKTVDNHGLHQSPRFLSLFLILASLYYSPKLFYAFLTFN